MGLPKVRKVAGTERSRFQLDFNMTGRLDLCQTGSGLPGRRRGRIWPDPS